VKVAKKLDYHKSVNYSQADPMKVLAQKEGQKTVKNMPFNYREVEGTRGESAYVFEMGDIWGALVQEGLGTKSLIAQDMYESTGKLFFSEIAQDSVACIINDLASVGATPVVLNAYWSSDSYSWLTNKKLAEQFIFGWREACDKAEVVWGGGETQSLSGIIRERALEFAGSAFGVIKSEKYIVKGDNLQVDDVIVLFEANGPHANGISLIREVAANLPAGYGTKLLSGISFGEATLQPTPIYSKVVKSLQQSGINIHYLSNITGHGWRKIMRADRQLSYEVTELPPVPEIFGFIQEHSSNSDEEMYGNYNMGAGYAVYVAAIDAKAVINIAESHGIKAYMAGVVKEGKKQVIIKPRGIIFDGSSLEVR
jgi:phosphoribosylformylglycinamidine cyclo-ligase